MGKKKKSRSSVLIFLLLIGGLAAYIFSTTLFGKYQCDKLYESLEFTGWHRVYLGFLGMGAPKDYQVKGKRVIISADSGNPIVFTKEKGALVTNVPIIGKITCKKP